MGNEVDEGYNVFFRVEKDDIGTENTYFCEVNV
jgi:hypothetical protein